MKQFYIIVLTLLLAGCRRQEVMQENQSTTPSSTYIDGTYKTIAKGYGGEFDIQIEIKDDKLVDVEVDQHHETPSIGGMAISTMKEEMVRQNTYDVDGVTGATYTSDALKKGVKSLLDQARNNRYGN